MIVLLAPTHPYRRHFYVSVYKVANFWKVVWRDFISMKQDAEFEDEASARAFARKVEAAAFTIDPDYYEDCCMSFGECTQFWASLD